MRKSIQNGACVITNISRDKRNRKNQNSRANDIPCYQVVNNGNIVNTMTDLEQSLKNIVHSMFRISLKGSHFNTMFICLY